MRDFVSRINQVMVMRHLLIATCPFVLGDEQLSSRIAKFSSGVVSNKAASMTEGSITVVGNIGIDE